MSTKESWEVGLPLVSKHFIDEIIEQVPEQCGARQLFVMVLNQIAAPSKAVQQRLDKLDALENYGVDNWEWYDHAMAELNNDEGDEDAN